MVSKDDISNGMDKATQLHCLGGIKDGEALASRAFSIVYNAKTQLDSHSRILNQCEGGPSNTICDASKTVQQPQRTTNISLLFLRAY